MKKHLDTVLTAVLVLCALVVTALVVRREFFAPEPAAAARPEPREIEDWRRLAETGIVVGDPAAPVRIVEFSDFQCPFCARVAPDLRALVEERPGEVALVFRHLPLEAIHPHAFDAAVASTCAAEQGRFEPMHDLLFERQAEIGTVAWGDFAAEAGVPDADAFAACLESEPVRERVRADASEAERLRIGGTPTLIVNGLAFEGALPRAELEAQVDAALERAD